MLKKCSVISTIIILIFIFSRICTAYDLQDFLGEEDEKTISMDFKDAALNDVLKIFSQQSGLNFISSGNISSQTLNLYLDNVPVKEALERILSANGLTYELKPESNVFLVKPSSEPITNLLTRVYQLRHASVSNSLLFSTLSEGDEDGGSGSEEGGDGILESVEAILSGDGTVMEDRRTNSLVITDHPYQFPIIEETIARLDIRIPQILIEAEMLDVTKNAVDLLGVSWGSTPFQFRGGATKSSLFPFDEEKLTQEQPPSYSIYGGDGVDTIYAIDFSGLNFAINFLRTHSDTKSLARPRILTLNNQTATIQITTNEAIGIASIEDSDTNSTTAEAEREETGVSLRVTPQANLRTGEITLAVEPKVKEAKSGSNFLIGTSNLNFKDPEERVTKSILRIKSGSTIVIGGLLRTDVQEIQTKVPVLSKIPLVGAAFRHKDKTETERELIVFITPSIVEDEETSSVMGIRNMPKLSREQNIPYQKLSQMNNELGKLSNDKPSKPVKFKRGSAGITTTDTQMSNSKMREINRALSSVQEGY